MDKNRRVDLHIHTYASDGEWSGEELLLQLKGKNIQVFAVSDHDTTECAGNMLELVKEYTDITFIPSVEISSFYDGREYHILAYPIDIRNKTLQDILEKNRDTRAKYNEDLMLFIGMTYPNISVEGYRAYQYNPYRGGWKAYHYLMDEGIISNLADYFKVIKGYPGRPIFPEPSWIIETLQGQDMKFILAHPPDYAQGDLLPSETLDYFRRVGINGLECYTRYLKDPKNAEYYVDYCTRYDLLITGGSDCHGGFAGRELGVPIVFENMIKLEWRDDVE